MQQVSDREFTEIVSKLPLMTTLQIDQLQRLVAEERERAVMDMGRFPMPVSPSCESAPWLDRLDEFAEAK